MHKNNTKQKNHRIDAWIPEALYADLRESGNGITQTVVESLTQYLHNDTQSNVYNQDLVSTLQADIVFLRSEQTRLQNRCDALIYASLPFWKRWKLILPPHNEDKI